jgi:hypothetical protein
MARITRPQGPNAAPAVPSGGTPNNNGRRRRQPDRDPNRPNNPPNHPNNTNGGGGRGALDATGKTVAANDHAGYFGSVVQPQFAGSYGMGNPFGQFLAAQGLAQAEQGYTNMLLRRPNLRFDRFLKMQGAGATPGALGSLGTGQAGMIDTGNPFTSSSGFGGPPGVPLGTPPLKKKALKQSPLGQLTRGRTKFATVGTGYTDALRRQWLSQSPMERGETALGKTAVPGRWSPWW